MGTYHKGITMAFDLGNLLQQYLGGTQNAGSTEVAEHFDQVSQSASTEAVGSGVAEALRSDQTPPFGQMVGQLFGNASSEQRAGMLNQLVQGLNPAILGSLGGVLGGLLGTGQGVPTITPAQADQIAPSQVEQIAEHAQTQDAGIIDRMGSFYAAHPTLVKTLGSAALAIVMSKMASRNRA
jgi:hypothetical protein